jgi:periplasmic divalent cation tolerance protein
MMSSVGSAQQPQLTVILTTFGTAAAAEACGRHLVEQGLAACVQLDGPIRSIYRWQGHIETDEEFRLLVKTTPAAVAACQTAITDVHPYDLPEIVVLSAAASAAYAEWVAKQTGRVDQA